MQEPSRPSAANLTPQQLDGTACVRCRADLTLPGTRSVPNGTVNGALTFSCKPCAARDGAARTPCDLGWCEVRHGTAGPTTRFRVHTTQLMTSRNHGERVFVRAVWTEGLNGQRSDAPRIVVSVVPDPEPGTDPPEPLTTGALELTRREATVLARAQRAIVGCDALADTLDRAVRLLTDANRTVQEGAK